MQVVVSPGITNCQPVHAFHAMTLLVHGQEQKAANMLPSFVTGTEPICSCPTENVPPRTFRTLRLHSWYRSGQYLVDQQALLLSPLDVAHLAALVDIDQSQRAMVAGRGPRRR